MHTGPKCSIIIRNTDKKERDATLTASETKVDEMYVTKIKFQEDSWPILKVKFVRYDHMTVSSVSTCSVISSPQR